MLGSDDLFGHWHGRAPAPLEEKRSPVVTYQIDRNIQLHKFLYGVLLLLRVLPPARRKRRLPLSFERSTRKSTRMLELGGTGILLQGGLHPILQIGYYENLLRSLKARYPQVHLHCFSAPEYCASRSPRESAYARPPAPDGMRAAIHSCAARILNERPREIARLKCTSDDWEKCIAHAFAWTFAPRPTMMSLRRRLAIA